MFFDLYHFTSQLTQLKGTEMIIPKFKLPHNMYSIPCIGNSHKHKAIVVQHSLPWQLHQTPPAGPSGSRRSWGRWRSDTDTFRIDGGRGSWAPPAGEERKLLACSLERMESRLNTICYLRDILSSVRLERLKLKIYPNAYCLLLNARLHKIFALMEPKSCSYEVIWSISMCLM